MLSPEEQQRQGGRCMECGIPFCQAGTMIAGMASGCPLHNLVPEMNDLVYHGNWEQAYVRLSQTHCLPEFTARVCPALCEAACTCGRHGDPVSTKENERRVIEYAFAHGLVTGEPPKVRTGKRVAVVGSGPSGLAAALQLNRRGHTVTVYERSDRPGGLLRYGIPNMKLEKWVIDRRVALMEQAGITFRCGVDVGRDVTGQELLAEYDRVIVLEDDLETSPFFLRFVNEGLERFADDERICQIHAYAEPSAYPEIPCFLRRGADCWGWGTWRRAWRLYNADGAALYRELCARRLRRSFDVEGAYPYTRMLRSQARGELDSWAIRWYASAFLAGRYMLQSNVPLVRNLGFDNSGTHGAPDRAGFALAEHPVRFDRTPVMETPGLRAEYRRQLRRARLSLPRRAALKVRRMLRKWSSINRRSHVVS